jgi:hypothetical protein
VRAGKASPHDAYDAFGFLPQDCSADDAYSYIVRSFKRNSGTAADTQKLLDRVHLYNKKRQAEVMQPVQDLADELVDANKRTLFGKEGKSSSRFFMTEPGKLKKHKVIQEG